MKQKTALAIIHKNRESYNQMAGEFSASRARFWDELTVLAEHAHEGAAVLDIGCGNGRFYSLVQKQKAHYTGIDNSEGLLSEARKQYPEGKFVTGDATALPFADSSFDTAYSFAVIHHIPSKALRTQFIREALRVLKPDAVLILTTWDLWQAKYFFRLLRTAMRSIFQLSPLDVGDMILTFGKEKHLRYVHAFTIEELRRLLEENGFVVEKIEIIARKSGAANIVAVARKKV